MTYLNGLKGNIMTHTNSFRSNTAWRTHWNRGHSVIGTVTRRPDSRTYQHRVHPGVESAETHQGGKHHSHQKSQSKGILWGEKGKQGHEITLAQFDAVGGKDFHPVTVSLNLSFPRPAVSGSQTIWKVGKRAKRRGRRPQPWLWEEASHHINLQIRHS